MMLMLSKKPKMKQKKSSTIKGRIAAIALALTLGVSFGHTVLVHADQFDEQINALRAANSQSQASANQLQVQADSYQGAINALQGQINALQASIDANKAKQADLQNQITAAEAELAKQKKVLGDNIRQMYLEGQISTLEMLASSKDLSEFVDKQQYRNSVQSKIQDTLAKITELKHQLNSQKDEVEKLLKDQQTMQDTLAGQRNQQNALLSFTEAQKDQYTQTIKANNGQISALRAQQAAANARLFTGANVVLGSACDTSHGDTYPSPWCSSGQDSMIDSWGMYNRECVSYTAWKVHESGRYMPYWGGVGNANQWDDNARAAGIPVDTSPRAGDVAIKNSQPYGHAMYVEGVNGDGTINISQYNASLNGQFSRAYNVNPSGLVFVHF
jgi:peptidoglycan DL-endopeptidase CwlO